MKLLVIIPILALQLLGVHAGPVAEPAPAPAPVPSAAEIFKRDHYCRLLDSVAVPPGGNCRYCPRLSCSVKHVINTRDYVIGVRCYVRGESAGGTVLWDYVPGWNCYVSASITNPGCENGLTCCNAACVAP